MIPASLPELPEPDGFGNKTQKYNIPYTAPQRDKKCVNFFQGLDCSSI